MSGGPRELVIVFTRFPQAGRTKTRLIPALGEIGAAELQRALTEHVVQKAWAQTRRRHASVEIRYTDGTRAQMRSWLGDGVTFRPQGEGDLGARQARAFDEAFAAGAESVLVIGADCPSLDVGLLYEAFATLRTASTVFGPALDGGYYLLGLRRRRPELFTGVNWGTNTVLDECRARARRGDEEPALLPVLRDIDEPADLSVWEKAHTQGSSLAVIVPALNEAAVLAETLRRAQAGSPAEILVADGGSHDETISIARAAGASVLSSPPGRAQQMNAGAAATRADILLFLHADTLLPPEFLRAILEGLRQPDIVGGAFRFKIREPFAGRAIVEWTTHWRSKYGVMPYGDQALFVRRWAFERIGGFPELPLMEDYEFVRQLRRLGRLRLLDVPVHTSGRRWLQHGFWKTTLINKAVVLGYRLGASPETLARLYRGKKARSAKTERTRDDGTRA